MKLDQHCWNKVADDKYFHYPDGPIWTYKKRETLRLIKKWGDFTSESKILKTDLIEEACRCDDVLFWISEQNKNTFGMDISPRMVKRAKDRSELNSNEIYFVACDVRKISFRHNSFDCIISNSTLDHFPEIDSALEELYRVLKPGGTLIITLHNKFDFTFDAYILWKKIFKYQSECYYHNCYSIRDAKKRLGRVGFKIEDSTTIIHIPHIIWVLSWFIKNKLKVRASLKQKEKVISYFERLAEKDTILNYFTGLLIALKVTK